MVFLDVQRQVIPVAEKILLEKSALWGIALRNNRASKLVAKSTKLEWKEMVTGAIKLNVTAWIASWYFDWTDKNFSINTSNLMVWDIISFQDSTFKAKGDLRIIITALVDSWTAKARKIGGSNIAITTTDWAFVDSMAEADGSQVSKRRAMEVPSTLYNFTQIIRAGHSISWTDATTLNYSFADTKKELREQAYDKFTRALDWVITSSVRMSLALPEGWVRRIAGWLNYFALNNFDPSTWDYSSPSSVNVKVVNGVITKEHINFAFKHVIENGGALDALVANTAQLMQIATLYQDKVNVNVINGTVAWVVGGAVQVLKSPINVAGNEIKALYLDTRMPQDEIQFFNTNTIEAVPLEWRGALEEITEPTAKNDNYSIDLLGEWTVKIKNAKSNTFVLKGLTLPTAP